MLHKTAIKLCFKFSKEIANYLRFCNYAFQRARPKNDQEENELVMASLRNLYEERQRNHQHTLTQDTKQVKFGLTQLQSSLFCHSIILSALCPAFSEHTIHLKPLFFLCKVSSFLYLPYHLLKVCKEAASTRLEAQQSSSRLEQFKSRAKRSLTESLEGIWKVTRHYISFHDMCLHSWYLEIQKS